jgi:hypothetical protein
MFANRMKLQGVEKECETHLASKWFQGPAAGSCCKLWDKSVSEPSQCPSILDQMDAPMLRSLLLAVGTFGRGIVGVNLKFSAT